MGSRVVSIEHADRAEWASRVAALEEGIAYPLGDDWFEIDHGADYFAFFDRLGDLTYYAVVRDEQVIAGAAGIVRRVPLEPGGEREPAWYLCDLKVHPDHRRPSTLGMLMWHSGKENYARCPRGYGITMNPADGSPNRVVSLAGRYRLAPARLGCILRLYSLDADAMRRFRRTVEEHRGPTSFLSLGGIKDIVLRSTGAPMPLLHVQFGPCAEAGAGEPVEGAVHMFCAPEGDPLDAAMASAGVEPTATASLVHHRMGRSDWTWVLTSDI